MQEWNSRQKSLQVDTALNIAGKSIEKKKNLQTFDLSYFNGRKYFGNDGSQKY